jgi:hypothetical protein
MDVQIEALDQFLINRAAETGEVELPVYEESVVAWVLHGPDRQKYDVNVAELSETGLVLYMDQRLPTGVWAKIHMQCGIVFGRIRSVAACLNGEFRVCIRVDELLPR